MGEHYQRGSALYENKRFADALKEFQDELSEFPGSPGATAMIACCFDAMQKTEEALFWSREAVALDPQSSFAHHILGRSLLRKKGFLSKEVLQVFKTSISLNPLYVQNYLYLAQVYLYSRRWKDASVLSQGLLIEARNARLLAASGWCQFHLGYTDVAMRQLSESLEIDPADTAAHRYLAQVYVIKGDIDRAREHITISHQIDPKPAVLYNVPSHLIRHSFTSHDLMSQIVMAHGSLYGKVLAFFARLNHFCGVAEARGGTIPVIIVILFWLLLCGAFTGLQQIDRHIGGLIAIAFVAILGTLIVVPLTLWLIALGKMLMDKQKRVFLTQRQRTNLIAIPGTILFVATLTSGAFILASKQQELVCKDLKEALELEKKGFYSAASESFKKAVRDCCGSFSLSSYRTRAAARQAGLDVELPDDKNASKESAAEALSVVVDSAYKRLIETAESHKHDADLKRDLESDREWCMGRANHRW